MKPDIPTLAFIAFLVLWGILIACVIGACGGGQRRCAEAAGTVQKGEGPCARQ